MLSIDYASRPLCKFTDHELAILWEAANEKNERLGITSGLYYDERVFYHVLEGEAETIWELMEQIRRDPRHSNVEVLVENDIASPSFRFWPVKFIDGRDSEQLQERFNPETLQTLSRADLNMNAFRLVRV